MFSIKPKGQGNLSGRYPQLNGAVIEDFVLQHSSKVSYWKAVACPCTIPETGQPNPACYSCRGLGFFHAAKELDSKYHLAQVTGRRFEKQQGKGGSHITGGVSITFQRGIIPGDGDLVQVCADIEVVNNEFHVLGSTLTDGSSAESLRFRDVSCVEMVCVYKPDSYESLILPADAWTFDPAQRRVIITNGAPIGIKYSVRYLAAPEYIILGDTVKPLLRVSKDESLPASVRDKTDVVYNFQAQAIRLDRAISQKLRGAVDYTKESTYNNASGKGPWR